MPSLRPAPRRRVLFLSLVLAGCAAPPAERGAPAAPVGPYLGQAAGDAPSLFAPGFVSRRYHEMNAAFSPDGSELYYTMKDAADDASTILVTRRTGGRWQPPRIAPFSGRHDDVDPMFSPDGTRLYFASYRPREPGAPPAGDADIWYVERRAGGDFGPPVHVAAPVNTPGDDYYPSVTRDGTLYYSTWDARQRTGEIFRARPVSGTYRVENVGAPINTEHVEYDPFVAPDESYLVFVSSRPGGQGDGDLYVSFRDGARWSDPANLGPAINTPAREYCPSVSADGRHFFFTSKRAADASSGERAAAWTIDEWTARYDAIGNGLGNIYWLRSDFLRDLRAPGRTP
jgi:Tol biopolymer transport system component